MIVLGLGANMESRWGAPIRTMQQTYRLLGARGICVTMRSPYYASAPLGIRAQAEFVNAVVVVRTALAPEALLALLKAIERQAGRRAGERWGPRPLDIDIIDYSGRVMNWPASKANALAPQARNAAAPAMPTKQMRGERRLVLPHPQLHLREFVLAPLTDVAPRWHHPVTGEPVARLLHAIRASRRHGEGRVLRVVHSDLT